MVKLSIENLEQILHYRKMGYTYKEISKIYGVNRTSICNMLARTFGKKRELKKVSFNPLAESELGEFIGFFMGDGYFKHDVDSAYKICFYLGPGENKYADRLTNIPTNVFGKELKHWKTNLNYIILGVCGRKIYEILRKYVWYGQNKTHSVRLRYEPKDYSTELLKGVIRGLVASDGTVDVPHKRVSFSSTSKQLVKQASGMLNLLGISSHIYASKQKHYFTLYTVIISKYENLLNFYNDIGITEPIKHFKLTKTLNSYIKFPKDISPSSLAA